MLYSRRDFLYSGVAVATGFLGLRNLLQTPLLADSPPPLLFGDLVEDPQRIIDLPPGFSYQVISRVGDVMDDQLLVPGAPDGMATFAWPDGTTILVRNHETTPLDCGPFGANGELLSRINSDRLYDVPSSAQPCNGGTTTVVYDTKKQRVLSQFLSLGGTIRNCAGGSTPWNSWITCEETDVVIGGDALLGYPAAKDHGFNFEVPLTSSPLLQPATPLKAMGRFRHEAVAVDATSGIVYQTEDQDDGLIYRFLPKSPGRLAAGGKLQALCIDGQTSFDTRNWQQQNVEVGTRLPTRWIDLHNVDAPIDDLRKRGFCRGAAIFARGEGMWKARNEIFFACTSGGAQLLGQIWRYQPSRFEGQPGERGEPGVLELFVEPNNTNLVHNADNLTISPWGDIIVCEDRATDIVRMVGITPDGRLYTLANNQLKSEFAGATFSPDGSTLFVNIQGPGLTLAICGPFDRLI